ncbi:glycoside hydrolase family 75 protein [Trichoderma asperellum CBS 433.97]|uniref:Endo-chitosanase n=1 Tax=Trichoderma asperellum (strain ATCC 204424 / CBS 433.97 / NBRC 101777) TaxID=1042311 RepID=A0A2T3Z1L0_TRIA4|nr:glycoside hydrolase family 75 protein [Trichoderma asperellum CBS 433.97]PTB38699.1 glycoside hydrolase family 75 protein [Trichoderma asperellum CBS 433.97]
MAVLKAAILASLASAAAAKSVPANLQNLYNSIIDQGSCNDKLASGFYSEDNDGGSTSYCGDHLNDYGIVYLQGTGGKLTNMDVDCDGIQGGPADDGRCGDSSDTQDTTAFADTVASYGTGQQDLDANAHPYVVFGNDGSKPGWKTFDPQSVGIEPLSVMAVVCNNQLIYGVWGDTNGDDGDFPVVGEASIALATACFGDSINGDSGHDQDDVLYIAFTGSGAVPGARGAQWNAQDYTDFENSISALGDSLVARIGNSSGGGGGSTGGSGGSSGGGGSTCSWEGHCAGASCGSNDDCSDDLTCSNGICSGHCFGAPCSSDDDCSDPWECVKGTCGN